MISTNFQLTRYDADEGKVFDWAEPRYNEVPVDPTKPEGEKKQEQQHLYAKTIFIGINDSITNYIEIDAPIQDAQ